MLRPHLRQLAGLFLSSLVLICAAPAWASGIIRPGERIEVTIYNHPELSSSGIGVNGDGTISLPLIGPVNILGLDETAAAARIETAYRSIMRRPAVGVRITQESQSIFFTGAMNGVEPFVPGETIGAAISSLSSVHAGDASGNAAVNASSADLHNLRIERDGRMMNDTIDLDALARTGSSGPQLEPGDNIHIPAKPVRVEVRGDIKTPGTVYLRTGETLAQAVAEAGGFSPSDSEGCILLTRAGANMVVSSAGSVFTAPAQDGDIITLQPAPHVTVLGSVQRPGDVELTSNPTLMNAVYMAGGPSNRADLNHVKITHDGQTTEHDMSRILHGDASQNITLEDGDTVLIPQGHRIDPTGALTALGALASIKFLVNP